MCLDHLVRAEDLNVSEVYDEIDDEFSPVSIDDLLYNCQHFGYV